MNICDQEELKHQLLQKFYELAEKPEEWERFDDKSRFYYHGPFRLWIRDVTGFEEYAFVELMVGKPFDYRLVMKEKQKIEKKVGWLFKHTVLIDNTSRFVTTSLKLAENIAAIGECKALEEALKRASQEAKPKKGRKAKSAQNP